MKLKLQFGLAEPAREIVWWQSVKDFPSLVLFKGIKWEFILYDQDPLKTADHIFYFSEVPVYDPNYNSSAYYDIGPLLHPGYGSKCECGALYTPFPWDHMRFCPKWEKW